MAETWRLDARVLLLALAGVQLAGAFHITPSSFTSNMLVGGRHTACAPAAGARADTPLASLRLAMRDGVSGEPHVASGRRMALEKGAAGVLALVLGANPLLAAEDAEEVEEVEAPAKEPTKPREVTFKAADKTCDDHPTWKQCRKRQINEKAPKTELNGLTIQELTLGKGIVAQKGDTCTVHYSLFFKGDEIMSSRESSGLAAPPIGFQLGVTEGAGSVVPAINLGIEGLKVGGIRRVTAPPELAFGARGRPPRIPGGATVQFDVQLLSVKRAGTNPVTSQGGGSTLF
mmetsp:Transcript_68614/g.164192  ORF Transcript_68614/g.164192 Transcript_68614/m.164192 type:complete len:288 (-) Transcript_68614:150-1013(-)